MELDKDKVPMTIEEMADTFINLLFAGHDTSAHTIARMLAELPRQPHVWEQLKKEEDAVSILDSHTHPCYSSLECWQSCCISPCMARTREEQAAVLRVCKISCSKEQYFTLR